MGGGRIFCALNIENNKVLNFRSEVQLIDAQRYKLEGSRFNSRWGHQDFSLS
jgi:hypothetical protein